MSQHTRRTFLKAGLAASGALVLGISAHSCASTTSARRQMALHGQQTGELVPNAWISVDEQGVITYTLDRVEMGQGTMTSHAMMVAEELEVDPAQIKVQLADADRRYDHSSFFVQITGGSTSVVSSWEPLRAAAASTREMLRQAAASLWEVKLRECVARGGQIVHEPTGRALGYGQLTRTAALLPVPSVEPKPPSQWKVLGKPTPRVDSRMKVDGSAVFGIDVEVPDLVHAYIVRPPVITGRALAVEDAQALKEPGVLDVFIMERGVVVVARRFWQALRAGAALAAQGKIQWDQGRLAGVSSEAMRQSMLKALQRQGKNVRDDGDAQQALQTHQARSIQATYQTPYLAHATMEPQNCTAHVTDERCELWAPTQGPGLARDFVSVALGMPKDKVIVHNTLLGGGFGRRLAQDYAVEAALIAKRVKRPVKVIWSREDDTHFDYFRPMSLSTLRGAVDERGQPVAWHHRLVGQSIMSQTDWLSSMMPDWIPRTTRVMLGDAALQAIKSNTVADPTAVEGADSVPYAIPNLAVEFHLQAPVMPVGFWRSVGHSGNAFVTESFIDELAHLGGQDPYALRRALLRDHPRARRVLELAAERAGWGEAPAGRWQGIAQHASFGGFCAHVVEVTLRQEQLVITRVVSAIDCGRPLNPDIIRAQIEGAVVFGLSAALKQQITIEQGRIQQSNFHDYPLLRMHESPSIEVHIIPSELDPVGVGETGLPPIAPALANAIFKATGHRLRRMPLEDALREALAQPTQPPAPSPAEPSAEPSAEPRSKT